MSARTYTDIWCDKCGAWEHGGNKRTHADARAVVARKGWRCIRREGEIVDLCPACAVERALPRNMTDSERDAIAHEWDFALPEDILAILNKHKMRKKGAARYMTLKEIEQAALKESSGG